MDDLTAHLHAQMAARVLVVRDSSGEVISRTRRSVQWGVDLSGVDEVEMGEALDTLGFHTTSRWSFEDRCWSASVKPCKSDSLHNRRSLSMA